MSKSKEKKASLMAVFLWGLIAGLVIFGALDRLVPDKTKVSVDKAIESGAWTDKHGNLIPKPEPGLIEPVVEPVADALAIASLKDYAGLEAERMAKMAAALMGMGGTYKAICRSAYDLNADKTTLSYRIGWSRARDNTEDMEFMMGWEGASWSECIQKMLAWKQGGE